MTIHFDDSDIGSNDEYGPGADLVVSLFAFALLLLTLFGVGDYLSDVELSEQQQEALRDAHGLELSELQIRLLSLQEENRGLRDKVVRLEQSVSDLKLTRDPGLRLVNPAVHESLKKVAERMQAKIEQLEIDLASTLTELRGAEQQKQRMAVEIEDLRARANTLSKRRDSIEHENRKLRREFAELEKLQESLSGDNEKAATALNKARTLIGTLRQQIAKLERRAEDGTIRLGSVTEADIGPLFSLDGKTISDPLRHWILDTLSSASTTFRKTRLNMVGIEAHTSADTISDPKSGAERSLLRTALWGYQVVNFLVDRGIPLGCMTVQPFGRSRSAVLENKITEANSRMLIRDFDAMLRSAKSAGEEMIDPQTRAGDRSIALRAIFDPVSPCKNTVIANVLDGLK